MTRPKSIKGTKTLTNRDRDRLLLIVADKIGAHGVADEIRRETGLTIHGEERGEPAPSRLGEPVWPETVP